MEQIKARDRPYKRFDVLESPRLLEIIRAINSGKKTQTSLVQTFNSGQSSVAEQLAVLLDSDIISFEKQGRTKNYSVNFKGLASAYAKWLIPNLSPELLKSKIKLPHPTKPRELATYVWEKGIEVMIVDYGYFLFEEVLKSPTTEKFAKNLEGFFVIFSAYFLLDPENKSNSFHEVMRVALRNVYGIKTAGEVIEQFYQKNPKTNRFGRRRP